MYVIRLWKDLDFAEFALADRDFALEGSSIDHSIKHRVILTRI